MTSRSASFHVDELLGQAFVLPPQLTASASVRRASFLDLLAFFTERLQSPICGDTSDALGHNLMKFSVCFVLPSLNTGYVHLQHLGADLLAGAHDAWLDGLVGAAWTGHARDDGLVDLKAELCGKREKVAGIVGGLGGSLDGLGDVVDVVCGVVRAGQQKSGHHDKQPHRDCETEEPTKHGCCRYCLNCLSVDGLEWKSQKILEMKKKKKGEVARACLGIHMLFTSRLQLS